MTPASSVDEVIRPCPSNVVLDVTVRPLPDIWVMPFGPLTALLVTDVVNGFV